MIVPAAQERLGALLSAELASLGSFIDLLKEEQEALRADALEPLDTLAARKNLAADELQRLARARNRELAALSMPPDAAGLATLMATKLYGHGEDKTLADTCSRLLESGLLARDLNQTNGKLIQQRLTVRRQALASLRAAGDRTGVLYGADGYANHATLRKHLTSA